MGLDINLNTSKIDISEEDGLNVDLYKDNIDISDDNVDDIIIEITGLKSINKFIGLEDTPLYYDNGKFFKVEDNKIIYTDIEWKDISGDISESPEIIAVISDLINEVASDIVDERINLHNLNEEAHPYIQNTIQENYNTLDTKIDDTKEELSQDILNLNDALNQEISDRETADNALSEDIQEETLARVENDTTLQNNINSVVSDLSDEISARESADTTLSNSISDLSDGLIQEITDRQTADTGLQSQITSNYNTLDSKIDSVESSLSNNINDLSDTVDANDTAINNKVDNINNTLTNSISTLSDTVSSNYTTLDNKIDSVNDTLSGDISDLSDTVSSNYTTLNNKIDDVNSDLSDDISTLSGTVSSNYTTLDNKIDSVNGALADSITALDNKYDNITSGLDDKIDDVDDTLTTHISDNLNPHNVTKTQVGLSNVDNTSDLDKPISTATQTALDGISNSLTSHTSNTNNPHNVTKTQIGLGNVDNTSDLNKPISTATQTALDGKVPNIRTVNNKPLSSDIILDYSDVNALPDTTTINNLTTTAQQNALNSGIDSTLTQQITTNQNNISNLSSTVSSNYTTLDNRITSEVNTLNGSISDEETARINADNGLQSQIDAITSASDVTDIVGTYAELQAYDTTGLPDKSIIKVLQDESRNDETTYYRWVITNGTGAWVLIGEEGPYYTKSEADGKFVNQTTTVNNKALSSNITLTASDVGALPDNTVIGDGTLTIQKNGTTIDTFTANTTSNKTINITVPTDTQDLTNGAGYITNSALNGYATESFVLNQGYITGITSTDVTTALGYVPYNSTNPSGYTTNVGTVTSVNNTQPDANGNVTLVIPDTATWGNISGTLSNQTDLQNALNLKVNSSDLATVATTGSYTDLINKPYVTTNTGITYVGGDSSASTSGTALGYSAKTTGVFGISIGRGAKSQADYAYQIGLGNNTTSYSLSIGFGSAKTYTLLDGNTGLIPDARLSSNIARISDIPTDTNDLTNGAGYITSSALNGYATETWVGNQGYLTSVPTATTSNLGLVKPDGTTITIDSNGVLSSSVSGDVDQVYDGTSANAQSGVAIEGELTTNYQSKLVSGTNIKTINSSSILGSGDLGLVTTNTAQNISGQKTFTSTIKSSVNDSLALTQSTGEAFGVTVTRTDANNEIKFGIGSGGDNRGIWDVRHNKWAFNITDNGKAYALGNEIAVKSDLNSLSPLRYSKYSIAQVNSTNKFIKLASMTHTQSGNRDFSYLFWVEILEASTAKCYALVRLNARWGNTRYAGHKFEILEKYGDVAASLEAFKTLTYAYSLDTTTHKITVEIWLEIRNAGWVSYYLRPTECNEYGDYSNTPVTLSNNIWTYYNHSGNASSIASTAITSGLTQVKVTDATGVRNENDLSQVIKMWSGTKAQYDAIVTKDANTLYNITDDSNPTLSMLELLYPVGSIYIGTMSACPLQTLGIGTWQLVAQDRVLQGAGTRGNVGNTLNESLPNHTHTVSGDDLRLKSSTNGDNAVLGTGGSLGGWGIATTTNNAGNAKLYVAGSTSGTTNATYQDNAPVQQNAYLVNIWERIS